MEPAIVVKILPFVFSGLLIDVLAGPVSLLPIETFFREATPIIAKISPDGCHLGVLRPGREHGASIWIEESDGSGPGCPVPGAEDVTAFFWTSNRNVFWQAAPAGERPRYFIGGAGQPATEMLASEKRVITLEGVLCSNAPCAMVGMPAAPTAIHSAFSDLYRVRLDGHSPPELAFKNTHQIITWAWDARGKPVAGLRWTSSGAKELLGLHERGPHVVFRVPSADDLRLIKASEDGTMVLVLTNKDRNLTHLSWIDLSNGNRRMIGEDPDGRVDLEDFLLSHDSILATSYCDGSMRTRALEPEMASMLQGIGDHAGTKSNIRIQGTDEALTKLLFSRSEGPCPAETCLFESRNGITRILWREQPELDSAILCASRPLEYPARDGCMIPACLTTPRIGAPPYPLVVFPHGGPRMRTRQGFDPRVQFLASRGYAVLQPDFRGSRGYGKAFMNAGDGQWGKGVMQTDVEDGVKHLLDKGFADKKRIAVLGGSYGGYAALAGLAFTPDRYAAGVCLFGISDLIDYTTNCPAEWKAFSGDTTRRLADPATVRGRDILRDLSPANHPASFHSPLLIYHGLKDPLIPCRQTTTMVEALKRENRQVTCLLAPDELHGFSQPESEMAVYRAIELFLHDHLGGAVGPEPGQTVSAKLKSMETTAHEILHHDPESDNSGGGPRQANECSGR